jgi:hypothetical protein
MLAADQSNQPAASHNQARFLQLLPAILACADFALRHLKGEIREDATQEIVANSYVAYTRLTELGKSELAYASPLARYAVAQYRTGRQVGTRMNVRDVTSPYARRQKGIRIDRLDRFDTRSGEWCEAVVADHHTPVADQVAFRLDFPAWLASLSARDRRLVEFLALGNAPWEAARKFGLCRARISQKRAQLSVSWQRFRGELPPSAPNRDASDRR